MIKLSRMRLHEAAIVCGVRHDKGEIFAKDGLSLVYEPILEVVRCERPGYLAELVPLHTVVRMVPVGAPVAAEDEPRLLCHVCGAPIRFGTHCERCEKALRESVQYMAATMPELPRSTDPQTSAAIDEMARQRMSERAAAVEPVPPLPAEIVVAPPVDLSVRPEPTPGPTKPEPKRTGKRGRK
jgi:hypothetical protein